MKIPFKLEKPAAKAGGDRYKAAEDFTVYVPQRISRKSGAPAKTLLITVENPDEPTES